MGYAHYYRIKRDLTEEEVQVVKSEVTWFLKNISKSFHSFSSGGYYKHLPMNLKFGHVYDDHLNITVDIPNYISHSEPEMSIYFKRTAGDITINTYRCPFDFVVQSIFIIINNLIPDVFTYSSDGKTEDWIWSKNTLNRLTNRKYHLLYLDNTVKDRRRTLAIAEVLHENVFTYIDGKRYINEDGIVYEVLTHEELYTACVNYVAETIPIHLVEHFDMDGFVNDTIKRIYDGSFVYLSGMGIGYVTEVDGSEYFVIEK